MIMEMFKILRQKNLIFTSSSLNSNNNKSKIRIFRRNLTLRKNNSYLSQVIPVLKNI